MFSKGATRFYTRYTHITQGDQSPAFGSPWDIKTNRKGFSWFLLADGGIYEYGTAGMRWPYQTKGPSSWRVFCCLDV